MKLECVKYAAESGKTIKCSKNLGEVWKNFFYYDLEKKVLHSARCEILSENPYCDNYDICLSLWN